MSDTESMCFSLKGEQAKLLISDTHQQFHALNFYQKFVNQSTQTEVEI